MWIEDTISVDEVNDIVEFDGELNAEGTREFLRGDRSVRLPACEQIVYIHRIYGLSRPGT